MDSINYFILVQTFELFKQLNYIKISKMDSIDDFKIMHKNKFQHTSSK